MRAMCMSALRNTAIPVVDLQTMLEMRHSTNLLHERSFAEFKGAAAGRAVVVVARGDDGGGFVPVEGAVHIGVNDAFRLNSVSFDFMFVQDASRARSFLAELSAYRPDDCIKFYGLKRELDETSDALVSESEALKARARRYRTIWWPQEEDTVLKERFPVDLRFGPLASFGSDVLPALQFALWMEPQRIYLVGSDLGDEAHGAYAGFCGWARRICPQIEMVTVDPTGAGRSVES